MRAFFVIGATLALCACGGADGTADDANMAADNMMIDQNMATDPMMNADANMAMDPMMNGTTNGVDPATQNLIEQDLNTNDPDTNLANGL